MVERLAAEQRSRKDQRVEGSENDDDDEDDHGGGEAADGGLGLGDHFQDPTYCPPRVLGLYPPLSQSPSHLQASNSHQPLYPPDLISTLPARPPLPSLSSFNNIHTSPSISIAEGSLLQTISIDEVLPRDLAMHILSLYFAHIYAIIPFIHKPSFMADLDVRQEEKRPELFALIMAMIATTLIHVPRTFFPTIEEYGVRRLSDHCMRACTAVTQREINNITVDLVCIKYLLFVIYNEF